MLFCLVIVLYGQMGGKDATKDKGSASQGGSNSGVTTITEINEIYAFQLVDAYVDKDDENLFKGKGLREIDGKEYYAVTVETGAGGIYCVDKEDGKLYQYVKEEIIPIENYALEMDVEDKDAYEIFNQYVQAIAFKKDRALADKLTDSSYYELNPHNYSEEYMEHFQKDLIETQEKTITFFEELDKKIKSGEFENCEWFVTITTVDEYMDDYGAQWKDIYFKVGVTYEQDGYEESAGKGLRLSVRRYPKGWKITTMSR